MGCGPTRCAHQLFVWPSSRFSRNFTVVVHLAEAKKGNFSRTLDYFDEFGAASPLVPPKLRCARTRWTHHASSEWYECVNVAPCDYATISTSPSPPPPRPLPLPQPTSRLASGHGPVRADIRRSRQNATPLRAAPSLVGWQPAGLRETCKAEARISAAHRERNGAFTQ